MTIQEQNKALERRINSAFNEGKLDLIDEIFDREFIYHMGATEIRGRDAFKGAMQMMLAAFPDFKLIEELMLADGEFVITRFTFHGTHMGGEFMGIPTTGKEIHASSILIARFENGKEVEAWEIPDILTMLQQLGAMPPMGPIIK